jgi:hypothetical protein
MSLAIKTTLLRALSNFMGDDLERAKWAFHGCTPEQMQELWGQSGKTRAEILAEYQSHSDSVNAAIEFVKVSL